MALEFGKRLRSRFWRPTPDEEVEAELRFHVDMRARELEQRGWRPDAAHAEAERRLGDRVRVARTCRTVAARRNAAMDLRAFTEDLVADLRGLIRHAARRPAFAAAAIVTFAVGIGVNAVSFSLVNALLFRPLTPVEPERVVRLYSRGRTGNAASAFPYADYVDIASRTRSISPLAAVHLATITIVAAGQRDQLLGEIASATYFDVRRLPVNVGRGIAAPDDRRGAPIVVVLSHKYWQRRFHADPGAVGQSVSVNGRPAAIVGVANERSGGSFVGAPVDVWLPLEPSIALLGPGAATDRSSRSFSLLGRLAPGVTMAQSRSELALVAPVLGAAHADPRLRLELGPGTLLHGPRRQMTTVLLTVITILVLLVLLVSAANVAGLMLARAIGQRRELAVRMALGAGRGRLARQIVAESTALASVGGAIGLATAWIVSRTFDSLVLLPGLELRFDLVPDGRVTAFTIGLTFVAALVASLAPTLGAARADLVTLLNENAAAGGTARARYLRNGLVVAQVAVSAVLLVAAGLLARSARAAAAMDLGFDPSQVVATDIDLRALGYPEARGREFFRQLVERVGARPDVVAVSLASRAPLDSSTPTARTARESAATAARAHETTFHVVGEPYFETVRMQLLAGRTFGPADRNGAPQTAVVNETFARRLWDDAAPSEILGRQFTVVAGTASEQREIAGMFAVVGVARDAKYRTIGEEAQPHLYVPFAQHYAPSATLLVRHKGAVAPVTALHADIAALDPAVQGFFTRTLHEHTRVSLLPSRIGGFASAGAGLVALLLGMIGLYGVIAIGVSERAGELGIRMALGATRPSVLRLVLLHAVRLTVSGCAIGFVLAAAAGGGLSRLLYGISPVDPLVLGSVAGVLVLATLMAASVPAWRAASIDPLTALRRG